MDPRDTVIYAFSPGKYGRSQTRGSDIPEKPPRTGMFFVCQRHPAHTIRISK